MLSLAVAAFSAACVSLVLTPLIRVVAFRRGWLDSVDRERRIHTTPVPRLGGIAIVIAFLVAFVARFLATSTLHLAAPGDVTRVTALLVGAIAIALLGIYDDFYGANATVKFTCQVTVAIAMYAIGIRIHLISGFDGHAMSLGGLGLPMTVLWIVGITNAVNLIDGLDGLAGGVAVIALASLLIFSLFRGEFLMTLVAASLGGAVIGFLVYNFNPARIFMGDTGSMFLGFMLAGTSIIASQKSATAVSLVAPVVVLGLPIADTIMAIVRRAWNRRPLFDADREHVHHRLLRAGFSHRQAVLLLYAVCIVLGLAAQLLFVCSGVQMVGILAALSLGALLLLARLTTSRRASADRTTQPERRSDSIVARDLGSV